MLLIDIIEILKLSRIQKFILRARFSIFCQFSDFLNVHLLKLIFISDAEVCGNRFWKSSVIFKVNLWGFLIAFTSGCGAYSYIVRVDVKRFEVFVHRNAVADL